MNYTTLHFTAKFSCNSPNFQQIWPQLTATLIKLTATLPQLYKKLAATFIFMGSCGTANFSKKMKLYCPLVHYEKATLFTTSTSSNLLLPSLYILYSRFILQLETSITRILIEIFRQHFHVICCICWASYYCNLWSRYTHWNVPLFWICNIKGHFSVILCRNDFLAGEQRVVFRVAGVGTKISRNGRKMKLAKKWMKLIGNVPPLMLRIF